MGSFRLTFGLKVIIGSMDSAVRVVSIIVFRGLSWLDSSSRSFPVSIRVSSLRLAILGVRLVWIRVILAGITFNMIPWLTILKTEVIFEATSIFFSRKAW